MPDLPPLVLLTDFGHRDAYVGVMKGVIATVAPRLPVIDLCHEIAPQDVDHAADVLADSWAWFPENSMFVAVVDPGVGTERRAIVARIAGRWFVGPDNGLCSRIAPEDTEVRALPDAWGSPKRSSTFHGRDLFAPAGARLAAGQVRFDDAVPLADFVRLPPVPDGTVRTVDHFGNAITNLPARDHGFVRWRAHRVPVVRTYGDGVPGALVALTGSNGALELAVPGGSAAALGVAIGDAVEWQS
jgi:S-adenosylmethionine hydrolase